MRNRFFHTTLGVDAQVFVVSAIEYSTRATIALFQANAVDGEMALYNAETGALIPGDAAMDVGTKFIIAVKRGTTVETSTPIVYQVGVAKKVAYVAPVKHVVTVTTTAPANILKGDYFELTIVETTPGLEPLPRYQYSTEAKTDAETWTTILDRLIAKINSTTNVENAGKTQVVTAVRSTNNVVVTAVDFNSHFTIATRGRLYETATVAVTTPFKSGSGVPGDVALAEEQGNIRKGVTTNYPMQNASAAEFGAPASLVSSTATYNTYKFTFFTEDPTRTLDKEFRKNYIFLYVPSNGAANPDAELTLALDL